MLLSASARGPATGGSESEVSLSSAGGGGGVPPSGRPKRPDLLGSLFASGAPPSEEETVGEADDGADSEASEVEVVLLAAVTAAGCFEPGRAGAPPPEAPAPRPPARPSPRLARAVQRGSASPRLSSPEKKKPRKPRTLPPRLVRAWEVSTGCRRGRGKGLVPGAPATSAGEPRRGGGERERVCGPGRGMERERERER
eukprot:scaffold234883_cov31-Tisochrysis_lutea.AAC.6